MILILGGTTEADKLASTLTDDFIVSLAGVTNTAPSRSYRTRIGGFGGVDGLQKYIRSQNITALVDATHPFAAQISQNAHQAATATNIPYLRLERPKWTPQENWITVATLAEAADKLPANARAFLTIGSQHLTPFAGRKDVWFLTRSIEPAPACLEGIEILQRPPFTLEAEKSLMQLHKITHLVSKNAGGAQTCAKLDAALMLGIPTIMVSRPILPLADTVKTIEDAANWIRLKGE